MGGLLKACLLYTSITLADLVSGIRVHLYYAVFPQLDVITRWVQIEHGGEGPVRLTRALSACLELAHMGYDLITCLLYTSRCV